jgi:hypothetical protein
MNREIGSSGDPVIGKPSTSWKNVAQPPSAVFSNVRVVGQSEISPNGNGASE